MCGGCLSVAYTLTGVRGNDDDTEEKLQNNILTTITIESAKKDFKRMQRRLGACSSQNSQTVTDTPVCNILCKGERMAR